MNIVILNGGPQKSGATDQITKIVTEYLCHNHHVENICLGEKDIEYCIGCKQCDQTGSCFQEDDAISVIQSIKNADCFITVIPSYWAEVPGQMKVFIDRCTPYSNVNPNRFRFDKTQRGFTIVIRTGSGAEECKQIIRSIEHFYGHMDIEMKDSAYFCNIRSKEDIVQHQEEIKQLVMNWII